MIEVLQQDNGLFAVRDVGGRALDDVLGLFKTQGEAEEWLLNRNLQSDARNDGPRAILPGGGQGLD